jgi:type IV pilus assembly protein PilY1
VVLATSNDGILYGLDASTGDMDWGWMPRPFVSQLSQYNAHLQAIV